MSLRWFHVLFISVSAALALLTTVWAFANGRELLGVVGLLGGGTLVVYRNRFIEKARRLGLK
jgi:hypothetical protein